MTDDFATLYRSHYPRVRGLCRRLLGHAASAEDAAQEAFVRAYRSFDRYDPDRPFDAWILGIATRHCVDLLRRRSREVRLFDDADAGTEADAAAATTLDALVGKERETEVRDAIAALPDRYRIPIVLAYWNEWSYEEIASHIGVSRNHVGVLLLRARHALRRALAVTAEPERA